MRAIVEPIPQNKRLFLTISEGETPSSVRPLLASEDPGLIRAVTRELVRRLGGERPAKVLRIHPEDGQS